MTLPAPASNRFDTEMGLRVIVQTPDTHAERLLKAVLSVDPLRHGDYDRVSFVTAAGIQRFRSLGTGRNAVTDRVVEVPCVKLSLYLGAEARLAAILEALYDAHPYEEPVIHVVPCLRSRHIRGMDEANPNRFWNDVPQGWVPPEHG